MKRISVVILALSFTSLFALAAAEKRDGNYWRDRSREAKLACVVGLLEGIELGHSFSIWEFIEDKKATDTLNRVLSSYDNHVALLSHVKEDQLVDGLDSFYTDYRNRSICIQVAVWAVIKSINGSPQAEIDKITENARRSVGAK